MPIPRLVAQVFSCFNLLRVLALFHESNEINLFPLMITKLFHLRYLAVKCYVDLPASISELQNLQILIQEKFRAKNTSLPRKIWAMKNLRLMHLGTISYLPNPRRNSIRNKHMGMPNLEELFGLCSTSCTNKVFSGIPNLKRLIIHQTPVSTERRDNYFIDMSSLTKFEALKCFNYNLPCTIERFVFPTSLKRLSFDGCFSFPWADISTLVMLPNLEELKLKDYAVKGEVWRLRDEDKFESLKLLVFSGLYLERWEASSDSFPNLKRLVLKKCFLLKEIPIDFGEICTLESIELHNCSIAAEDSATIIEQEQADMGNNSLKVSIQCSRMRG
uniref:Late blight resistance protein homolog R1A-3 n=2 Tax=Nicotiana sylvestris TaxID=4096 RepID=A0A1U7XBJ0_NICSY|nr:PREDICTED: putative late blight resistance protein homolog R1A-3 [Nicotiana sylvestris]